MRLLKELDQEGAAHVGKRLHDFASELYPICRSITGNGTRQTLAKIREHIALELSEVPTGTRVFDWIVPREWNTKDAYIKDKSGRRIVDFRRSNLHVVNYSVPVHAVMSLSDLKPHLFSLPDRPDWIPYRTSYYQEDWGFCLGHNDLVALTDGEYEVCIDASLRDGHLSYGECYLPGELTDEVFISSHICHPSLANDNLSGLTVATALAGLLAAEKRRYSYRFLFAPGTIGAIAWLARNRDNVARIKHGLVLTGIGDAGGFHYKKSRRGNTEIDQAMAHVLRHCGEQFEILDFSPHGYDERQYCSPGFNLPVGCLMRSVWGTFPEYHTSADNLDFIQPRKLADSLRVCTTVVDILENNRWYRNLSPYCEPQLGKRNLYQTSGNMNGLDVNARLWVLNFSDGEHSLLDIADRSGISFHTINDAAQLLSKSDLLAVVADEIDTPRGRAWGARPQRDSRL